VTVFGQSAGAMSVATLMATPCAAGLFHRAIAQSGAGHHNLSREAAQRVAERTLQLIDVAAGDWEALRAVPADRLVEAATQVSQVELPALLGEEAVGLMAYLPVVDGVHRDQLPVEVVRAGRGAPVELLVGTTADEMNIAVWGLPEAYRELVPEPDVAGFFAGTAHSVDDVLATYDAERPGRSRRQLTTAVWTDQHCTIPALRLAEAHAGRHPTRVYRFDWATPVAGGGLGACHSLELPFVFDCLAEREFFVGPGAPQQLATAMHAAWVRFAADGDPGGGPLPPWPVYDLERRATMVLDVESSVVDDPAPGVRELWDGAR